MIIRMHMCGPSGDVRRQQLTRLLNELKRDNEYVVNAMLNAGQHVPDTVVDLGLTYDPADGLEKDSPEQDFFGLKEMIEKGTFRCGDGSAYEAAVLEQKYGVPTQVLCVPQGTSEYHAIFVTPEGPIDPVENWLIYWEARMGLGSRLQKLKPSLEPVEPYPMCEIDPVTRKVACSGVEDTSACCLLPDRTWRCPGDHPLHGQRADVRGYQTKGGQRLALVGSERTPVPVCPQPTGARRRPR